jgi:hypothetical protein
MFRILLQLIRICIYTAQPSKQPATCLPQQGFDSPSQANTPLPIRMAADMKPHFRQNIVLLIHRWLGLTMAFCCWQAAPVPFWRGTKNWITG